MKVAAVVLLLLAAAVARADEPPPLVTVHAEATPDTTTVGTRVRYTVTVSARKSAHMLGFGEAEIVACTLALTTLDFHKTMESESAPGHWQDVYRPVYAGLRLYVKVQVQGWSTAVVISFKER